MGDNIFYGHGLEKLLESANRKSHGATVFGYYVKDPERYGVVTFNQEGKAYDLEEKPRSSKSNYAVTGLYFYDERAPGFARSLQPSRRGELEITDLNRLYLEAGELQLQQVGRGVAWLDTGTPDSLLQAANFVQTIQERQGLRASCPEEISFRLGWIDAAQLRELAQPLQKTGYGQYLARLASGVER